MICPPLKTAHVLKQEHQPNAEFGPCFCGIILSACSICLEESPINLAVAAFEADNPKVTVFVTSQF